VEGKEEKGGKEEKEEKGGEKEGKVEVKDHPEERGEIRVEEKEGVEEEKEEEKGIEESKGDKPHKEGKLKGGKSKEIRGEEEDVSISGFWVKNGVVTLPRRLGVMVVGLPIQRKDIAVEGGRKAYLRVLKVRVSGVMVKGMVHGMVEG
jgi:hypothetical protein